MIILILSIIILGNCLTLGMCKYTKLRDEQMSEFLKK